MAVPFEVFFALAAVIIFAIAAYLHRSLETLGLAVLAVALMFHFGIRLGG
jgi:hypothetical protein